jgi:hypothetical protein
MTAKKLLFTLSLIAIFSSTAVSQTPNLNLCKSTYALCTTALCTAEQVPGKGEVYQCACNVKAGYSVGTTPCQDAKHSNEGDIVISRYYPIKFYAVCSNDRPWADCLDASCVVDKYDKKKATCACRPAAKQGDYVILPKKYSADSCTTGTYSSATVTEVNQVTDFLKTQSDLKPFEIKVLNPKK